MNTTQQSGFTSSAQADIQKVKEQNQKSAQYAGTPGSQGLS